MKIIAEKGRGDKGIALITVLLATTVVLALGMAVVLSATNDTTTTNVYRISQQAFLAADGGLDVARRALERAFSEQVQAIENDPTKFYSVGTATTQGTLPPFQVLPDPSNSTQSASFNSTVLARAAVLSSNSSRNSTMNSLNGSSFSVSYQTLSGSYFTTTTSTTTASQTYNWKYYITVTGTTTAGGSATVNETGNITTTIFVGINTSSSTSTTRAFAFSGFAAFFDQGDQGGSTYLASGTFTGPVHTNTHFAFNSGAPVTFKNLVSQVDSNIRYNGSNRSIPTSTNEPTGISVSPPPQGYQQTSAVPLPTNSFSQELAVINGSGLTSDAPAVIPTDSKGNPLPVINSSGEVTAQALQVNLRDAGDNQPSISSGSIANGVYIGSADGKNVSGAGIYVQGEAADIGLTVTNGTDQVYTIKQGSTTTTITVSIANNTTTISSGTGKNAKNTTLTGVPTDRSDPNNVQPGVSLFVDGTIDALHGPSGGSSSGPAIGSLTRLTITGTNDITITGDLTYANAVVDSNGNPLSNISSVTNVLGIFTADGNVNLAPSNSYTASKGLGMETDAAISTFNSNTSNDNGVTEGSITYTGSQSPGSSDLWKLVGSRVQKTINSIGYSKRNIYFDPRFGGGTFAPPFYPGTTYSLASLTTTTSTIPSISNFNSPSAQGVSWFRTSN